MKLEIGVKAAADVASQNSANGLNRNGKYLVPNFQFPISVFLSLVLLLPSLSAQVGKNLYVVEKEIHLEKPQNFGVNFESKGFSPWTSSRFQNFWNQGYSMEPIIFRHNNRATGGGADYLEDKKGEPNALNPLDKSKSVGAGFWSVMTDGFWDGGEIAVYRETEDSIRLVRKEKIKKYHGSDESEQRIYFEKEGEPVQKGDLYVLTMTRNTIPSANLNPKAKKLMAGPLDAGTPSKCYGETGVEIPWEMDSTSFAPENGSAASLKLALPGASANGEATGVGHQYLRWGGKEMAFNKGKEYICEVWLKQSGLSGPVLVQIGDRGSKEVQVTGEWQKFSFGLDNTTPITKGVPSLFIGSKSAGTLWIDNFIVYEKGLPPFAIYPEWENPVVDWKPGIIRSMNGRMLMHFDVQITEGFNRKFFWTPKDGLNEGGGIGIRSQLELCKKSGASPWLMTYVLPSEEELDHLMEYLGAPADVGFGKVRAAHGQTQPWTEVFDKIYVEVANEMWNGIFAPQAFPSDPELCGKLSTYVFRKMKGSPHNTRKNIMGMSPGWAHSIYKQKDKKTGGYSVSPLWTFRCARACKDMDALATAPSGYIGGWDGQTAVGASDTEMFQSNLLYPAQVFEPKMKEIADLRADIKASQSREFEIIKYEAGPGYSLPNPGKPFQEQEEIIGKSLALAIATLDNFLFVIANNGNSNYFMYDRGNNWSSHSLNMDPHTTWLALALRNNYCKGAMLKIKEGELARVDVPEIQAVGLDNKGQRSKNVLNAVPACPLTRLYAFKEGKRHSIIALNRSFTAPQEITIELPYDPKNEYTEYLLSHENPRITNRDALNVKIQESAKTGFGKKFSFTLSPASACVLVNEEK